MKDERLTDCPLEVCDGAVKRLLGTGAGIIFKGSGFYETDYKRGDSYNKAAKADSGEGGKAADASGPAKSNESAKPSGGKETPKSKESRSPKSTSSGD